MDTHGECGVTDDLHEKKYLQYRTIQINACTGYIYAFIVKTFKQSYTKLAGFNQVKQDLTIICVHQTFRVKNNLRKEYYTLSHNKL